VATGIQYTMRSTSENVHSVTSNSAVPGRQGNPRDSKATGGQGQERQGKARQGKVHKARKVEGKSNSIP